MKKIWKGREIKLNENQSFFLMLSVMVITILAFIFGYTIGKSNDTSKETALQANPLPYSVSRDTRTEDVTPIDKIETTNLIQESELTFYDTLTSETEDLKPEIKKKKISLPVLQASNIAKKQTHAAVKKIKYTIQIAAFKGKEDAHRLKDRLDKRGYDSYVMIFDKNGSIWYRVRIGMIEGKSKAVTLSKKILNEENLRSFIVRVD